MRVILSTGGTGGHIFPAIAIAEELKLRIENVKILFVGAEGKMEMQKIPQAGYEIIGLPIRGLKRSWSFSNLKTVFLLMKSLLGARKILRDFDPDIVMGFGAFASAPVMFMSKWTRAKRYIHEQNAFPGKVNMFLSSSVNGIFVAYEGLSKYFPNTKITLVGNPVRKTDEVINRVDAFKHFDLDPSKKMILVTGGSGGAKTLNKAMLEKIDIISTHPEVQWIWQCGKVYYESILSKGMEFPINLKLVPFIDKMTWAMSIADLVFARAGATTISELAYWEKASVLIPSPNVTEDHQTKNAMAMVNQSACGIIHDDQAVNDMVKCGLEMITDEEKLYQWSKNIGKLKKVDTAELIVNELIKNGKV